MDSGFDGIVQCTLTCFIIIILNSYVFTQCIKKLKKQQGPPTIQAPASLNTATDRSLSLCSCSHPSLSLSNSWQQSLQGKSSHAAHCISNRSHPRHSLSNNNRDDILEKFFQPIKNPRRQLPSDQIHGGGISLWDLAKRSIPIHAFEPLSVLQAICEELRFADRFLNKLYDTKEADQRMIMVIGFIVSGYTCLVGRNRKPVNPILGETFDFISKDGWKYHAEQVSHHPAISASYANCPNDWEWFQTLHTRLTPSLDSATMESLLPIRLRLANGDEYSWNKVTTTILNLRAEADKRRICNEGTMLIRSNTDVEAELRFINDENNTIEGEIRKKDGKLLYHLVGSWDKGVYKSLPDENREPIFVAAKPNEFSSRQYGFNEFTVQLNEITKDHRFSLPPTDSRLRPDIRYLENAEARKAELAKKELEQAQRVRASLVHRSMWFIEDTDPFTNQRLWLTNRQYWFSKQSSFRDAYSRQILPLFQADATTST